MHEISFQWVGLDLDQPVGSMHAIWGEEWHRLRAYRHRNEMHEHSLFLEAPILINKDLHLEGCAALATEFPETLTLVIWRSTELLWGAAGAMGSPG